jgi:hypothetical protein
LTTLEDRFERYRSPVHVTGTQVVARVIIAALVPPRTDAARDQLGPVRNHHDGQE